MFKDVSKDRWSAKDIQDAARYGLMMGTAPDMFSPTASVTREQLAAVAVRLYRRTNEDFVEVIDDVLPSVVQVENWQLGGLGSGTIIHPDGYVLTNCHVISREVRGEKTGEVIRTDFADTVGFRSPDQIFDGSTYAEGPVLAYDVDLDLAICKIGLSYAGYKSLPLHAITSSSFKQSQKVLAIGSPLGLIRSVSEGVVSAVRRGPLGKYTAAIYIQTDAAINPGNSGGALVDLNANLIGVPSLKLSSVGVEGLGFAVGVGTVRDFIQSKVEEGKLPSILTTI
jgi:S1-C subfamily serine protease